jgi:hypothetical protein
MKLSNKTYDVLSNAVKLVIPAIGTLYFTIATVWDLPYGDEVVGSLAALATFLGVTLAFAKKAWNNEMDGSIIVDQTDPEKDLYSIELNAPLEELTENKSVALKVVKDEEASQ